MRKPRHGLGTAKIRLGAPMAAGGEHSQSRAAEATAGVGVYRDADHAEHVHDYQRGWQLAV
jgi:hypothetical protein